MQSIDPKALQEKMTSGEDFVLIDVREAYENELFNIGGLLVPMNSVFFRLEEIPKDKPVVFYCQKGIRSALVIQRLQQKYGYENLLNLAGGMEAWKKQIT